MARRKKSEAVGTAASGQCLKCRKIIPVDVAGLVLKHRNHTGGQCAGIGSPAGPPPPKFGTCPVCFLEVEKDNDGIISGHRSDAERCGGAGRGEYKGPPVGFCETCGDFQKIRGSDGRIVSHRADGQHCKGSGSTPGSGRDAHHMRGLGMSVVRGGLPGKGKSSR